MTKISCSCEKQKKERKKERKNILVVASLCTNKHKYKGLSVERCYNRNTRQEKPMKAFDKNVIIMLQIRPGCI